MSYYGQTVRFVEPEGSCRTPSRHPYTYDLYFLWGDKHGGDVVYHDRLAQWDGNKFEEARVKATAETRPTKGNGRRLISTFNKQEASVFLSVYFGRDIEALGMAEGANQSNGFPYWIFWFKDKQQ